MDVKLIMIMVMMMMLMMKMTVLGLELTNCLALRPLKLKTIYF